MPTVPTTKYFPSRGSAGKALNPSIAHCHRNSVCPITTQGQGHHAAAPGLTCLDGGGFSHFFPSFPPSFSPSRMSCHHHSVPPSQGPAEPQGWDWPHGSGSLGKGEKEKEFSRGEQHREQLVSSTRVSSCTAALPNPGLAPHPSPQRSTSTPRITQSLLGAITN